MILLGNWKGVRKGERVKRRGGTIIARRSQPFEIRFGAKIKGAAAAASNVIARQSHGSLH